MRPEQQRLTPGERANLVAYLDGELNEAETRVIATKLTQSATARREVEVLEKTWELLNYLPRPQASERLTERTLTEIQQLSLKGGRLDSTLEQVWLRALRVLIATVAALLALFLGYALTKWVWPNPTARLTRDLTIAEHLDEYRDAGTFEFLEALAASPEFSADAD
jgi:anti-sigma factor RsiW